MLRELPKQKEDTNKVKFLCNLANSYADGKDPDIMKFSLMARDLAEKLNWEKGIYLSENTLGMACALEENYDEALKWYNASLAGWEKLHNNNNILNIYENLRAMYTFLRNNPKTLEYDFKILKMDEQAGNEKEAASELERIAEVYVDLSDYQKELEYLLKALKIYDNPKNSNPEWEIISLQNAAVVCQQLNKLSQALDYSLRTINLAEKIHDTSAMANAKGVMALVYTTQKKYGLAIECGRQSLEMSTMARNTYLVGSAMYELGDAYLQMAEDTGKNYGKITSPSSTLIPTNKSAQLKLAFDYLSKAFALKKQITDHDIVKSIYKDLSDVYRLNGDYKKAFEYYQQYTTFKDSITSNERAKKILAVQMQNDFDNKEAAAKAEQDKKDAVVRVQRYAFIGGGILLLLLLGLAVNRYRFEHNAKKTIAGEKQRSDELLLNILPAETADELKKYGKASAKGYDQVTVLFADIKGFTIISENLGPDVLVKELDTYFQAFDNVIDNYDLEKIKTIGDAYLCVGGLPVADANAPEKVISAAMDILNYLEKVKAEKAPLNDPYFEIRIGIHTGPCVAGVVGVKKFAYDIWGDTVNTAARMEQNSEAGRINISETTYQLVKDKFNCTYRGLIEAKNKGEIKMYFVDRII